MQFVDTNILLYAISNDPQESAKAAIAREILDSWDLGLSTQVLQEFFVQATRVTRTHSITVAQASALIEAFSRFAIQEVTLTIIQAAISTHQRFQLSYWDSAIIEAARALGCNEVLSEDLSHGTDYAGVRVSNPFL